MLEHLDEVLVEQYIRAENMTKIERDICMLYLSNIKDIKDSDIKPVDDSTSTFTISEVIFKKHPAHITFNGSVSNGTEDRLIDGYIIKDGRSIMVKCNFYRLNDAVNSEDKNYNTVDTYRSGSGVISRKTQYLESGKNFRGKVELNINDLNDYYRGLIGKGPVLKK